MTSRKPRIRLLAATVCAAALLGPGTAIAQDMRWLQVEAHRDLDAALAAAQAYDAVHDDVAIFALPSGWHAISIGPFDTDTEAFALRRQLRAERVIPLDAFVSNGNNYLEQIFPEGFALAGTTQTADDAPDEAPDEAVSEDPDAPAAATDSPPALAQAALAEAALAQAAPAPPPEPEPQPEPELDPEPDPQPEPEPEPEPEETLREAQASERLLTRDERAEIQTALQWFGFYTMAIDAAFGPGSRRAMTAWQQDQGLEPTGVLTTRQRAKLMDQYSAERGALGMATWRDEEAGISIDLPLAMLRLDRHETPFVHFAERDDSGMRALLISQSGNQATLFGLYEIMQTLEIVPLEGARERQQNGFLLTGQSEDLRSHTVATLRNGQIKGYTLIWTPERDDQAARILPMMEASFSTFGNTLPDSAFQTSAVGRGDLLSGLTVRRPEFSRSGFYVDAVGTVLTSAEAVANCARITIDEAYDARVVAIDETLGLAVLKPELPLVPLAFAQFHSGPVSAGSAVTISGFSFEDMLTRPVLTFGQISALGGPGGAVDQLRLSATVKQGDLGGPVFGSNGAVIGLLSGQPMDPGRQFPPDVNLAVPAEAIQSFLSSNNIRVGTLRDDVSVTPERLTRLSGDLTVLVSCWK